MWIFMNDSFVSIVEPEPWDQTGGALMARKRETLLVRARRAGDIERAFGIDPGIVMFTPDRDYAYRAYLPRRQVSKAIGDKVRGIQYSNFKDSIANGALHAVCSRVWSIALTLQGNVGLYAPRRHVRRRIAYYEPPYEGDPDEVSLKGWDEVGGPPLGDCLPLPPDGATR